MATDAHAEDGRPVIPTNYADLLRMAAAHVSALTQGHGSWGLGRHQTWAVDLDRGTIEWRFSDRVARAPVELIGTWASDLGTYRWGWDHPAIPAASAPSAQAVKSFADTHRISELQSVELPCSLEQAQEIASTAVLIGDLQGLFVGQASRTALAYLGFGEVTLSSD
jgi:hypothetical protein